MGYVPQERNNAEEVEGAAMSAMLFNCDRCDGSVEMVQGGHRTREYRPGIELPVPENFPIPTCRRCGETYLTEAEAEMLEYCALNEPKQVK